MYFSIQRSTWKHDFFIVSLRNGFTPLWITLISKCMNDSKMRQGEKRKTSSNITLKSNQNSIEEVPYCLLWSSVKFLGHTGQKIAYFDLNWVFLDFNSSLNSPMALKPYIKLDVVEEPCCFPRSSVKFQGHTGQKILTWIERLRTVTQVWIHGWLWNYAKSLM